MISDRRRGSDQSWTGKAKELVDQLDGLRAKKVNQRELTRQLKSGNYKSLEECLMLEAFEALLREEKVPKTAEGSDLVAKLQGVIKEASEVRQKAVALKDASDGESKLKDLINEAVRLKVSSLESGQLPRTAKSDQRRCRRIARGGQRDHRGEAISSRNFYERTARTFGR